MGKPELGWADDANGNVNPLLIGNKNGDGTVEGFIFGFTSENGFGVGRGTIVLVPNLKPVGGKPDTYQA